MCGDVMQFGAIGGWINLVSKKMNESDDVA
jgi:hypothetical protein